MTRRDYGEGGIRERKNAAGEVTGYQVSIYLPDGRKWHTAKIEREAKKWLREAKAAAARGELTAKRPPTLAEYLEDWLKTINSSIKPRSLQCYRLNVNRVPGELGRRRLDEIKPGDIQKVYNELAGHLAPRSVRQFHRTLHKALEDAVHQERITRNPTTSTRLPRVPDTEMQWYGPDELAALFEKTEGERFHALWLILGTLGLRLNEALGLQWADVDWERGTLCVRRSLYRDPQTRTLELAEPKTKSSKRTLTMPAETVRALKAHQDRQEFAKNHAAEAWQDRDFIFCTQIGTPLDIQCIHRHWRKACQSAGIPRYRPHDLRHSAASNLIAAGMGMLEVAKFLGQTNAQMVATVYGHVRPDDHRRAAALMDALLGRQR